MKLPIREPRRNSRALFSLLLSSFPFSFFIFLFILALLSSLDCCGHRCFRGGAKLIGLFRKYSHMLCISRKDFRPLLQNTPTIGCALLINIIIICLRGCISWLYSTFRCLSISSIRHNIYINIANKNDWEIIPSKTFFMIAHLLFLLSIYTY
jgi:hypothetical protein